MFENDKQALWVGVNGCEYISWEGSYDIYEYDPYYCPLPSRIIHSSERIYTEQDMMDALSVGEKYTLHFRKEKKHKISEEVITVELL